MNESALLFDLISKGGIAGTLVLAVSFVAKKLAEAYESRIVALEKASAECERDRREMRNMILTARIEKGTTFNSNPDKSQ